MIEVVLWIDEELPPRNTLFGKVTIPEFPYKKW
jgi:hypothetical protein